MQPDPPPERVLDEPEAFEAKGVRIVTVGLTGDPSAEVIARRVEKSPAEGFPDTVHWFRFNMKPTNRIIRKFLQKAGIRDPERAEEGAYQYLKGLGPFKMRGLIAGIDSEDLGDGNMSHTFVLADVTLGPESLLHKPPRKLEL
jgi:hypothetical protein